MPRLTIQKKAGAKPLTVAQRLDRIIKSARQIMRKDKGLNGDLDRLPMLTWIMFLKFLDDMERIEETRAGSPAAPTGRSSRHRGAGGTGRLPPTESPAPICLPSSPPRRRYSRTARPAGTLRLPAWLTRRRRPARPPRRGGDRVPGFSNRMESGYLLRDVVNLVDGIRFDSSEEIHVLGRLYETLLREMRDAAGDSGEFYTPRPVVRFMVETTAPKLGETVLDPACGTGGFLVEAFTHLERQADTVEKRAVLQDASILAARPSRFRSCSRR